MHFLSRVHINNSKTDQEVCGYSGSPLSQSNQPRISLVLWSRFREKKMVKVNLCHKFICLGVTSKFKPFYLRVLGGLMVLETDPDTEVNVLWTF